MPDMDFDLWMQEVEEAVQDIAGVSVYDLANQKIHRLHHLYHDDVAATDAAYRILEEGYDAD